MLGTSDADGQGTDFPPLAVCARAQKKGRCKGNDDTERESQCTRSDCAGERPQAEGMEERGQGGMKAQVKFNAERNWWEIQIFTAEGFELSKAYPAKVVSETNTTVSDAILCEIAHLQDIGYEVTVLN